MDNNILVAELSAELHRPERDVEALVEGLARHCAMRLSTVILFCCPVSALLLRKKKTKR